MAELNRRLKDIVLKDLIFVILYGGLISILLGVVLGFIDYYLRTSINFSLAIMMFFFSAQYIGRLVRKQYTEPHVVYSVITGIFLVFQAIIIYGLPLIYQVAIANEDIFMIFDVRMYLSFFLLFLQSMFVAFSFNYVITILVIAVGTYVGIKNTY